MRSVRWSGLVGSSIAVNAVLAVVLGAAGPAAWSVSPAGAEPAGAAPSVVVNTTGDEPLPSGASGCDVDATTAGQQCTLRAAIAVVNASAAGGAMRFAIPGTGVPVVTPASALPAVTEPVVIDASSQPGGWVRLDGAQAGPVDGLEIDGAGSSVRGLVIGGFADGSGLVLGGTSGGQVVAGDRIGTDVTGTSAAPNRDGITATAPQVVVGGTTGTSTTRCAGDCVLVSGNVHVGIEGAARVVGDFVGTTVDGTRALPNATGVEDSAVVGGKRPPQSTTCQSPCNLISGNTSVAIHGATDVVGNFVGTDVTGTQAVPNGADAAVGTAAVDADGAIGGRSHATDGVCDLACNLVSGNATDGVRSEYPPGPPTTPNPPHVDVQGNVIGVAGGGAPLGNDGAGVISGANGLVGGGDGSGNLIAHNAGSAVQTQPVGTEVTGNVMHDNAGGIDRDNSARPHLLGAVRIGTRLLVRGTVSPLLPAQFSTQPGPIDVYSTSLVLGQPAG